MLNRHIAGNIQNQENMLKKLGAEDLNIDWSNGIHEILNPMLQNLRMPLMQATTTYRYIEKTMSSDYCDIYLKQ